MCSEMLGIAKLVLQIVIDSDVHCNCMKQSIDPSRILTDIREFTSPDAFKGHVADVGIKEACYEGLQLLAAVQHLRADILPHFIPHAQERLASKKLTCMSGIILLLFCASRHNRQVSKGHRRPPIAAGITYGSSECLFLQEVFYC